MNTSLRGSSVYVMYRPRKACYKTTPPETQHTPTRLTALAQKRYKKPIIYREYAGRTTYMKHFGFENLI